jgi:hypothetical protein
LTVLRLGVVCREEEGESNEYYFYRLYHFAMIYPTTIPQIGFVILNN